MYSNEVHKCINEAPSTEMVLIVTGCNVYFSLFILRRNLLDMDTFSKSDPGKWIILILQYEIKYFKETSTVSLKYIQLHYITLQYMHSSSAGVSAVCSGCFLVVPNKS